MKSLFKRPIVILLLSTLIFKLILFLGFAPWETIQSSLVSDSAEYHHLALQLLHHHKLSGINPELGLCSQAWLTVDTFRTPGYPFIVFLFYFLFGINPVNVLIFQIFIATCSVLVIYKITLALAEQKTALLAAVLLAIDPDQNYYTFKLMTETSFVFFLLTFAFFLVRFLHNKKYLNLFLAAVFLSVATYIRPISLYIPVLIMIFLVLFCRKDGWIRLVKMETLFLSIVIVLLSPWYIRNYIHYGTASFTTIGAYNLLFYNVAYTEKSITSRPVNDLWADYFKQVNLAGGGKNQNPFKNAKIYNQIAFKFIRKNALQYVKINGIGMLNLYTNLTHKAIIHELFGYEINKSNFGPRAQFDKSSINLIRFFKSNPPIIIGGLLNFCFQFSCYLGAIIGIYFLFKSDYRILLLIMGLLGYFTLVVGCVGLSRYRVPITPFYLILTSIGISSILKYIKNKKHQPHENGA